MGLMLVDVLFSRVQTVLQDSYARWPGAELLLWLNDGQREVVLLRPQANVVTSACKLSVSSTKHAIPDGVTINSPASTALAAGVMLVDVVRNMGADGATPGRAVRVISRDTLDQQNPDWHTVTADANGIRHVMYDPRNPKVFYTYGRSPATAWYLEIAYAAIPADCTWSGPGDVTNKLQLDDVYANAMVDYILFRAYSKDSEYAQNAELALAHYNAFATSLGVKSTQELNQNVNQTVAPFNPNVVGAARP